MAFGSGGPKVGDVKLSPERQLAKMREQARSGGYGGGTHSAPRLPVEPPITPEAEETPPDVSSEESESILLELTPDSNDKDMEELLGILQTKGFKAAVKELDRLNNPHLEDDFHRLLVQYRREGYAIPGLSKDEPLGRSLDYALL